MPITEQYANSNASWGTEYSLTGYSTTIQSRNLTGVYQVFIDCNALAVGDTYVLRLYERARAADTQRLAASWHISGPTSEPLWASPSIILLHGWDFTLQRIAGSDRTITWSVRRVS